MNYNIRDGWFEKHLLNLEAQLRHVWSGRTLDAYLWFVILICLYIIIFRYIKTSYIHKYSCSINKKEHNIISSEQELNQWPMDYNWITESLRNQEPTDLRLCRRIRSAVLAWKLSWRSLIFHKQKLFVRELRPRTNSQSRARTSTLSWVRNCTR